mmetsp:Transcript_40020/g.110198  ORF Transcript_40020/g.110198 Transcript_40020/m.110198 type:complete len:392 (-) Transcript_40020:743-1918(-)
MQRCFPTVDAHRLLFLVPLQLFLDQRVLRTVLGHHAHQAALAEAPHRKDVLDGHKAASQVIRGGDVVVPDLHLDRSLALELEHKDVMFVFLFVSWLAHLREDNAHGEIEILLEHWPNRFVDHGRCHHHVVPRHAKERVGGGLVEVRNWQVLAFLDLNDEVPLVRFEVRHCRGTLRLLWALLPVLQLVALHALRAQDALDVAAEVSHHILVPFLLEGLHLTLEDGYVKHGRQIHEAPAHCPCTWRYLLQPFVVQHDRQWVARLHDDYEEGILQVCPRATENDTATPRPKPFLHFFVPLDGVGGHPALDLPLPRQREPILRHEESEPFSFLPEPVLVRWVYLQRPVVAQQLEVEYLLQADSTTEPRDVAYSLLLVFPHVLHLLLRYLSLHHEL